MTFMQVQARCGMEGLDTFGTKKQLLERLRQHLGSSSNDNVQRESLPNTATNITSSLSATIPSRSPPIAQSPSSFDPDLHDIPPEKDDFYQHIKTDVDHDDIPERIVGSVIYNPSAAKPIIRSPNPIQASRSTPSTRSSHSPRSPMPGPSSITSPSSSSPSSIPQNKINTLHHMQSTNANNPSSAPTSPGGGGGGGQPQQLPPQQQGQAQDWIMVPDPRSGKMYFYNLKTNATRWDPPPGFGINEANLNPGYDPGVHFQHPLTK